MSYYPAAELLQELLEDGEVFNFIYLPITDHYFSAAINNGFYELWNITTGVLIVPICIDDDICTKIEAGIEAFLE